MQKSKTIKKKSYYRLTRAHPWNIKGKYTKMEWTNCPKHVSLVCLFLVGEHCHQFIPTTVDRKARRKLIIASILCVVFMIGEVVGKFENMSCSYNCFFTNSVFPFSSCIIYLIKVKFDKHIKFQVTLIF